MGRNDRVRRSPLIEFDKSAQEGASRQQMQQMQEMFGYAPPTPEPQPVQPGYQPQPSAPVPTPSAQMPGWQQGMPGASVSGPGQGMPSAAIQETPPVMPGAQNNMPNMPWMEPAQTVPVPPAASSWTEAPSSVKEMQPTMPNVAYTGPSGSRPMVSVESTKKPAPDKQPSMFDIIEQQAVIKERKKEAVQAAPPVPNPIPPQSPTGQMPPASEPSPYASGMPYSSQDPLAPAVQQMPPQTQPSSYPGTASPMYESPYAGSMASVPKDMAAEPQRTWPQQSPEQAVNPGKSMNPMNPMNGAPVPKSLPNQPQGQNLSPYGQGTPKSWNAASTETMSGMAGGPGSGASVPPAGWQQAGQAYGGSAGNWTPQPSQAQPEMQSPWQNPAQAPLQPVSDTNDSLYGAAPMGYQYAKAAQMEQQHREYQRKMIAVHSPKGGVGKSTIAKELALALSTEGRGKTAYRVLLVDADWEFGDVATLFNVDPFPNSSELVRSMLQERKATGRLSLRTKEELTGRYCIHITPTLDLLCGSGRATDAALIDEGIVNAIIDSYKHCDYDYIIFDNANSVQAKTVIPLMRADYMVLVETLDTTTITETGTLLSTLRSRQFDFTKLRMVFNQVPQDDKQMDLSVSQVANILNLDVVAAIPDSGDVRLVNNAGDSIMLGKETPVSRELKKLVNSITPVYEEKKEGFFSRLFKKKK